MEYTAETPKAITELFCARQKFYHFLNLLFSSPIDESRLIEFRDNGALKELEKLNEGGMLLSAFLITCTLDELKHEQEEYSRLFSGPGSVLAPPWESFYTSREQILFGENTLQVREIYREFGLKYKNENRYPDDHLTIELEYMMKINQEYRTDMASGQVIKIIEKQLIFLEQHLSLWIPHFCDRVIAHTGSKLYSGAASILKDFILFDMDLLKEIKEELSNGTQSGTE